MQNKFKFLGQLHDNVCNLYAKFHFNCLNFMWIFHLFLIGWPGLSFLVGDGYMSVIGEQKNSFIFSKDPGCYNQEVLPTLFHLFTIATHGRNCFDMQHWSLLCNSNIQWSQVTCSMGDIFTHWTSIEATIRSPSLLTHWHSHLTCLPHFQTFNNDQHRIVN